MAKKDKASKAAEPVVAEEVEEVKKPRSSSRGKAEAPKTASKPVEPEPVEAADSDKKSKKQKKRSKEDEEEEIVKDSKKARKAKVQFVEEEEEEEEEPIGDNEVSLGERLEMLSKQLTIVENGSASSKGLSGEIPTTESMVTLLDQALQSSDEDLLEQCLQCSNIDIISATTRQLSTHRVLALLKKLVAKFERRPSRGLLITQWLSHILRNHIGYLITVPDLAKQLAGLSQMLEQRMQSYTRLSSLAGRLDLLMAQVSAPQALEEMVPQTVYVE